MKTNLLLLAAFGLSVLTFSPLCADTIAGTPEAYVETASASICLTPERPILAQRDADDDDDDKEEATPKKKKSRAAGKVGKALEELTFVTDTRPNLKAKYYIYLCSASWCGPCNAEMPHVVEAYKEMKKSKVELILVSADNSEEAARGFLKKYGAQFPVIMSTSSKALPGFTPPGGIPHAIFVDAKGNVLHAGHGSSVMKWREHTGAKKGKDKKSKKKA